MRVIENKYINRIIKIFVMKRSYAIGIVLVILGFLMAMLMTTFLMSETCLTGQPCSQSIDPTATYFIGIFYVLMGIGLGTIGVRWI